MECLIAFIAAFALGCIFVRSLKGGLYRFGLRGADINKPDKPMIPESGGMLLLPGIWVIVLGMVYLGLINPIAYVFLFTLTCFAAIGFFDDGFGLFKKGENWRAYLVKRGLVLLLVAMPFAYLNLGQAYLVPVSIGIVLIASLANSFAGLNGWEVGSSLIVLAGLTIMASFSPYYTSTLVYLGLVMTGSVAAFLIFNKFPAKIFPGDSGTLLFGSFMACMVFFIEPRYFALPLFIPHLVDICLKFRSNPKDMSQKTEKPYVLREGKLDVPQSGRLDFAKCLIRYYGPSEERMLVRRIWFFVAVNTAVWTGLFIISKTLF